METKDFTENLWQPGWQVEAVAVLGLGAIDEIPVPFFSFDCNKQPETIQH